MSQEQPKPGFDPKQYQRPNTDWVCGHLAEGHPCEIGPNAKGECCVELICQPFFDGKSWNCTRSNSCGGRCDDGPVPVPGHPEDQATCPHLPAQCVPVRSLRSKRKLVTGLVIAASLGICLLLFGGSSGADSTSILATSAAISPGDLTPAHASIEAGCAACHTAAESSPLDLLATSFNAHNGLSDSQKCLECHDEFGEQALFAHSMDPANLDQVTLTARNSDSGTSHTPRQALARKLFKTHQTTAAGELACATCHQEHNGQSHDLTFLTNAQCQSCHTQTFHSFVEGHPDFPPAPRAGLRFDHVTHLKHHFQNFERLMPDGIVRSACADCHTLASNGATIDLASYDHMCGSCHDQQIRDFDMPADLRLPDWKLIDAAPEETTKSGSVSTLLGREVPLFLQLLLAADPDMAALWPTEDKSLEEEELQTAQAQLQTSLAKLIRDLKENRENAIIERLQTVFPNAPQVDLLLAGGEQLEASRFTQAMEILEDALKPDPETPKGPEEITLGNWIIDTERATLVYRATRHADPLLKSWIDLLAQNAQQYEEPPTTGIAGITDRLFRELAAPEATGRCLKCHTLERNTAGTLTVNWFTKHENKPGRDLTHFSHGPHITIMRHGLSGNDSKPFLLNDCQSCHALSSEEPKFSHPEFVQTDGMPHAETEFHSTLGIDPVTRTNCISCHQPQKAGDNCVQCHNYHVHR